MELVNWLAKLAPVAELGSRKLGWLKMLNTSKRNWMLTCSVMGVFLKRDMSTLNCPGPTSTLRGKLPLQPRQGMAKNTLKGSCAGNHPLAQVSVLVLKLVPPGPTSGRSLRSPA